MGKLSAPLHWWLPLHVTLSDPSHQVASNSFSFIALHLKHLFLLVCILCTCHFYCQQFLRWKRMELCINFVLSNAWWTLAALQSLSVSIENDRSVPEIVLFFFFSLLPTLPSPQNAHQSRKKKIINWQSGPSRKLLTGKCHGSMPLFHKHSSSLFSIKLFLAMKPIQCQT